MTTVFIAAPFDRTDLKKGPAIADGAEHQQIAKQLADIELEYGTRVVVAVTVATIALAVFPVSSVAVPIAASIVPALISVAVVPVTSPIMTAIVSILGEFHP